MELRLHKLPEGFIVTSDEPIKEGDIKWHHVTGIRKALVDGNYTNQFKVMAQQDQIDFSALTEEEQKEIGWFEVADLAHKDLEDYFGTDLTLTENGLKWIEGFQIGFQKAQELLSDRRFTLDDMIDCFNSAREMSYKRPEWQNFSHYHEKVLSQHKSWTIEVEMDINLEGKNGLDRAQLIPKFTDGKLKVTKILS
jgi:hypothetical protein